MKAENEEDVEKVWELPNLKDPTSQVNVEFLEETDIDDIPARPRTWKGKIWDSFDYPREERWYMFKLDITLLFAACTMVFTKALDQANLSNAFVSGMKEELGLYGNQLNIAKTLYGIGYCIGQIPVNMLIVRVKPHIFLPCIELMWGITTLCSASYSSAKGIYASRFFVGLFEAATYPSLMYLFTSCYKKTELAKRSAVLHISTQVGPMFSGYLQSAAYVNLNNVHGLAGWRWLFIIDGIFTIPLGLITYFLLPDFPRNQSPNWIFNESDVKLAKLRMPVEAEIVNLKFNRKSVLNWFGTWHLYFFVIFFTLSGIGADATDGFSLWFKSYNTNAGKTIFTVPQINNYPTGLNAVSIVSDFVAAYISDNILNGKRFPVLFGINILFSANLIALGAMPVYPKVKSKRWALYYLLGTRSPNGPLSWDWVNESLLGDPMKRAFVSGAMSAIHEAFASWTPLVLFPTNKQPDVPVGLYVGGGCAILAAILCLVGGYIQSSNLRVGFFRSKI